MLRKELVNLSVGKWRQDELTAVHPDLVIIDGEPEFKSVMADIKFALPSQRCLFHLQRHLYFTFHLEKRAWEAYI